MCRDDQMLVLDLKLIEYQTGFAHRRPIALGSHNDPYRRFGLFKQIPHKQTLSHRLRINRGKSSTAHHRVSSRNGHLQI